MMDRSKRKIFLDKIAVIYEDPNHPKRIRDRSELFMEQEDQAVPIDPMEEQRAVEEFIRERDKRDKEALRKGDSDPRFAIIPDQVVEKSPYYVDVLKQHGINPDSEPLSKSEIERQRKIREEIEPYATIGEVETAAGSVRHYVDPNGPSASPLNKYFGYYDKDKQRWYPTQYSYIMFFLSAYAPELDLTRFWDRSRRVDLSHQSFKSHPYRRKYPDRLRHEFFLFKPEMEDRLYSDFPKIMAAIRNNVWDTNVHTREGLPYVSPTPPDSDKRFSGGVEIRYMSEHDSFMVRGPQTKPEIIKSTYEPEASDALRITKKVLSKVELYTRLGESITSLKKDITDNILREILASNRELNFIRRDPQSKEMVRGAIVSAVNELLNGEVIRIVNESDF